MINERSLFFFSRMEDLQFPDLALIFFFLYTFIRLKEFYYKCSNLQYFKHLVQVPSLPDSPPNFLTASGACMPACLPACLSVYKVACQPVFLPACLPEFLSFYFFRHHNFDIFIVFIALCEIYASFFKCQRCRLDLLIQYETLREWQVNLVASRSKLCQPIIRVVTFTQRPSVKMLHVGPLGYLGPRGFQNSNITPIHNPPPPPISMSQFCNIEDRLIYIRTIKQNKHIFETWLW